MADSWPVPKPAVKTTIALLRAELSGGLYVKSSRPVDRPDQYVTVGLMNSDYPNPAMSLPRPLVEVWGRSTEIVEVLSNQVVAAVLNAKGRTYAVAGVGDVFVFGVKNIQGPVEYNDPDITDRLRWQIHFDMGLSTI